MTLRERLLKRINRDGPISAHAPELGNCWIWLGSKTAAGYGQIIVSGRRRGPKAYVHRLMFEMFKGPIPDGMEVDHLCRNTSCVRPKHLEAVTHRENMLRAPDAASAVHARLEACSVCGGDFDFTDHKGARGCRACKNRRQREYTARKRQNQGEPR